MFERGFIGPIGDDLPSLIPIVTGLVIFFSVFVLTLNAYNEKNDFLERQISMTSVSRDLKGDSLILNWDQFYNRCRELKVKRYPYSFMVAIYGPEVELGDIVEEFRTIYGEGGEEVIISATGVKFLSQPDKEGNLKNFYCGYDRIGGRSFQEVKRDFTVRFYPIAVQQPINVATQNANATQYLVVPAVMAMVVWE